MNDTEKQIAELNKKMDVLLDYVNKQRLQTQAIQDFIDDASIIGKDVYDSTVEELDKRQVELQPEELTQLGVSFLRNVGNFNLMMSTFESLIDLSKDLSPIINESIMDFTKLMADMEAKGYFEFFKALALVGDEVIKRFTAEDLLDLKEKLPRIIDLAKQLSDEKTLLLAEKAVGALQKTDVENPPSMGLFSLITNLNKPGTKKTMGMLLSLSNNMYK
ncbi:MAG: hypothetical protein B7C24_02070 [Bacteroidetes bacterium 4572_77]|nr:MAG: hypothetical protein B7C24_02070 [Bacteroidetes bacterium 4572_77]